MNGGKRMSTFNYWVDIQRSFADMIGEIGTSVTIEVPTLTVDSFGNHVSTTYATYTETIWERPLSDSISVEGIGQLEREDLRFVAPYNTNIVVEARITLGTTKFIVLGIDKPNVSGNQVTRVGYAKRELT